jgi:hypothetical protein
MKYSLKQICFIFMLLKFRIVTDAVNLYTIKHGILSKAKKDLIKSLETLKTEIQF